jgi:hypothetical protein
MRRGLSELQKRILIAGYQHEGQITYPHNERNRETGQRNTRRFFLDEIYRHWGLLNGETFPRAVSASISRTVNRLEKRGLINMFYDGAYRKGYRLTEKGMRFGRSYHLIGLRRVNR